MHGFDIIAHLWRQRKWSWETFGSPADGRDHKGPLKHAGKELKEIAADPDNVEEWADGLILLFDGAMRAGHTPVEIMTAIASKHDKNERRVWPDWRTVPAGEPIEHVRGIHD